MAFKFLRDEGASGSRRSRRRCRRCWPRPPRVRPGDAGAARRRGARARSTRSSRHGPQGEPAGAGDPPRAGRARQRLRRDRHPGRPRLHVHRQGRGAGGRLRQEHPRPRAGRRQPRAAPDVEEWRGLATEISQYITEAGDAFRARDAERCRQLLSRATSCSTSSTSGSRSWSSRGTAEQQAVARALAHRYLKRVVAHLMNLLSAVIMPLDRLDYFDEDPEDRLRSQYEDTQRRPIGGRTQWQPLAGIDRPVGRGSTPFHGRLLHGRLLWHRKVGAGRDEEEENRGDDIPETRPPFHAALATSHAAQRQTALPLPVHPHWSHRFPLSSVLASTASLIDPVFGCAPMPYPTRAPFPPDESSRR
jgi:hypothetical protein